VLFIRFTRISFFSLLVVFPLNVAGLGKVAFVDMKQLLTAYLDGQPFIQDLERRRQSFIREGQRRQKRIEILKDRLEKYEKEHDGNRTDFEIQRLSAMREEILYLEETLAKYLSEKKQELKELERQHSYDSLKNLYDIIRKIAEKEDFYIVLDYGPYIMHLDEKYDITRKVLRNLRRVKRRLRSQ
jgi:Skp family chaperone for outer membrane proteins